MWEGPWSAHIDFLVLVYEDLVTKKLQFACFYFPEISEIIQHWQGWTQQTISILSYHLDKGLMISGWFIMYVGLIHWDSMKSPTSCEQEERERERIIKICNKTHDTVQF